MLWFNFTNRRIYFAHVRLSLSSYNIICVSIVLIFNTREFVSGWAAPPPPTAPTTPNAVQWSLCEITISDLFKLSSTEPHIGLLILILFTLNLSLVVQTHIITSEMTQQCSDLRALRWRHRLHNHASAVAAWLCNLWRQRYRHPWSTIY